MIRTVGPPPSELVIGCYLSERSVIIFFDFLLLLVFELGENNLVSHSVVRRLDVTIAVVVLTVWNGYRDCAFLPPLI